MRILKEFMFKDLRGDVYEYSIKNRNDIEVKILNLGGIVKGIFIPDKDGKTENIVVSWKNPKDYKHDGGYTGGIIGRTAGRIADGEVTINNKIYSITKNGGVNTLHGGNIGFNKKIWEVSLYENNEEAGIILETLSEDGEEGYPGEVSLRVKYTLNNDDELKIEYYGKSTKDTLLNMTNHSYFNLSGNLKRDVLDEILTIKGKEIACLREDGALSGEVLEVKGTEFDFNEGKVIGKDINGEHIQLKLGNGYDHPWLLDKGEGVKGRLEDKLSGRFMEVYTDRDAMVVYTTNFPENNKELSSGGFLEKNYGICFETQNLPIGEKESFKEGSLLKEGEEYRARTVFKFGRNIRGEKVSR